MKQYSEAAVERMMKVREVILRALAKRITWWQAAEILGISDRSMRRWRERYQKHGYDGLLDLDGSRHRWFQDERWHDFLVVLDDATSEIYYAQLVEEESTRTVMVALKEVVERKGLFCALYSDRASHFFETPKAGQKVDLDRLTQVGRAMKELGIPMIPAYSPQARGRSERNFGTWQGLPQELRLAGMRTLEEANRFPARALHGGIQPALCGAGRGERDSVCAGASAGPGSGLLPPARARGESRQHRAARSAGVA